MYLISWNVKVKLNSTSEVYLTTSYHWKLGCWLLLPLSYPCCLDNCAVGNLRNSQTQLTPEDAYETVGTDVLRLLMGNWPLDQSKHGAISHSENLQYFLIARRFCPLRTTNVINLQSSGITLLKSVRESSILHNLTKK